MKNKKCSVEGCNRKHFGKGLCHNHHELNRRNGTPSYKKDMLIKCSVPECKFMISGINRLGLCKFHVYRRFVGIELNRPFGIKGKLNPNWKGGIAEYPNHSLMKRVRKEILKESNNACHYCSGFANQIHHKDLSKDNHSKENFVACCHKCNHLPQNMTSKYKRLYGRTLKELQDPKFQGFYSEIKSRLQVGI